MKFKIDVQNDPFLLQESCFKYKMFITKSEKYTFISSFITTS